MRIALADLAEGLREGDCELAMLAERHDGVADCLGAGHLQFAGAEAGDQAPHPLVTPGRIQSLHEIADRQPMAERRPRQRSARPTLRNSVGEIQGQHGTFGHRMLRLGKKPQRNRGTQDEEHDDGAHDCAQGVDDAADESQDVHGADRFLDLWVMARNCARRRS